MSKINDGGPAFPGKTVKVEKGYFNVHTFYPGMTLRQWYAGQAMKGLLASNRDVTHLDEGNVRTAFRYADLMIAEDSGGPIENPWKRELEELARWSKEYPDETRAIYRRRIRRALAKAEESNR